MMDKIWSTMEVLRQTRHDWLNKIQMIKGNLELNKLDRVKGIIDEIIIETQQEAMLSNLNLPKFSELLMTANWYKWAWDCEYEVMDVFEGFPMLDELISQWTYRYFCLLAQQVDPVFTENILIVSLGRQEGTDISCSFHLYGKVKNQDMIIDFLKTSLTEQQMIRDYHCDEHELFFIMDTKFA